MYKIEAIIRPHRLDAVREALEALDLISFTVSDCRGAGRQVARSHTFRGSQYAHSLEARIRLDVILTDSELKGAVDAIQKAASTGEVGDGKIFVFQVADAVRIRTGEHGDVALL